MMRDVGLGPTGRERTGQVQDRADDNAVACALPRRSGRRFLTRCGLFAAWSCGIGTLLVVLTTLAALLVLARGPFETEAAARAAERALAELGGPGSTARVAGAGLDWSWSAGLSVALSDIAVERDTALRLDLPRLVVRLRLLPLLIGRVQPRAVEIQEPRLSVDTAELRERGEGGVPTPAERVEPGTAPATGAPPAPVSTRLAESVDAVIERAVALAHDQGFETFQLRGGRIDVHHVGATGIERQVHFVEIDADGVVDGPAGEFDAGISARGDVGRWSMRLTRTIREDGGRRLRFSAEDVTLPDLIGPGGPAFALGVPFYPRLVLGFAPGGHFDGADLDLRLGAGLFRFGQMPEDQILLDELTARAAWNPKERVFALEQLAVSVGETHGALHGRIMPPPVATGPWGFALAIDEGALKPRDVAGPAVPIKGGGLTGSFDPTTSFLDVTLGEIRFGAAELRSAGRLDLSGEEPKLTWDLQFSPMTTAEVAHAWPHWVAPDARAWFVKNVSAGRLTETRIQLAMPRFDRPETWPGEAMRIGARFDGLRFTPLGNLPAVTAAEGHLSVTDRRFEAAVEKGRVATKGREPTLESLKFSVADIFFKPPRGSIRFRVAGDAAALAEIADAEPLAVLSQAGIAATGFSGTGSVGAQIDVVFDKVIDAKSIDYKVDAQLDGFSATQPIQGRRFQDGKFKITADPRGLDVSGRAVVDGVPTDVHVFDPRGGSKTAEKRDFKMEVDDAARQRLGIDLGGIVEGAIGLSVSQPDPNQTRSHVEADLAPSRLNLAVLGWTKGPGVPAKASFDLWDDDRGLHLDNVVLESEGLTIRGSLLLDKDRNLVAADFPKFALRKGDDAKIKVTRGADKALTIAFEGGKFDVRGLLRFNRRPNSAGGDTTTPDLVLKLRAGALLGFNDTTLSDVSIDGRWHAGAFQALELKARTQARRPLSVSIRPEAGRRRLTVASEDAGAALSFLDLFDRIQGGTLTVSARLDGPGTSIGTLRLLAFHLLEEPKAGRITASKEGADGIRQVPIRRAEIDRSTNFDRASVHFAMHDGIIDVTEGVAKGASVGATATGQIDVAAQRLSLSGTYIPAYGLNNLAGRIPILGAIAGAGSNEGLVGVTFRVVGAIDDPILQINPLSAVAPGIFRRIFEFQNEEMPQGGGDPNAPTRLMPGDGPTKITP